VRNCTRRRLSRAFHGALVPVGIYSTKTGEYRSIRIRPLHRLTLRNCSRCTEDTETTNKIDEYCSSRILHLHRLTVRNCSGDYPKGRERHRSRSASLGGADGTHSNGIPVVDLST
jgi:hypothetical protein